MNWNNLNEAPAMDWYSVELKAEAGQLEQERAAIVTERTSIDDRRSKLEAGDVADSLANADSFRQTVAACLQRELAWRERYEAFLVAVMSGVNAESTAAYESLQATEAAVVAFLEKGTKALGGYKAPIDGEPVLGSWSREMVLRHPAVVNARARCTDAVPTWAHDLRGANASAGESTLIKLQKLKTAALAV